MRLRPLPLLLLWPACAAAAPVPDETAALNIARAQCASVSKRYEYRFFDQWRVDLRDGIWFVTATYDPRTFGLAPQTLGMMIPRDGSPARSCAVVRPDLPPWRG